jgi:Short C-terminal domain/Phospholipase_D-nuclease N-terminal
MHRLNWRVGTGLRVALIGTAALLLAGCAQVGGPSYTFWDAIWTMIAFFFWIMAIWIFIAIFGDIFRRNDLSGGWKAIWILLLIILPFLGALIYIISRPKVTPQDVQMMAQAEAGMKAAASVSTADELAKLQQLKESGAITVPEYEALKAKLLT